MNTDDAPLSEWLRAGFPRTEAEEWRRRRFELSEARAWQAVGIHDPLTAARWRIAAVTPETVQDWIAAGIGPVEAVRWHEFDMDLETAARLTGEGRPPDSDEVLELLEEWSLRHAAMTEEQRLQQEAVRRFRSQVPRHVRDSYEVADRFDDEALSWARRGVQAEHTRFWTALGLYPEEVADLGEPPAVVAEWWRAGIPYDEVADWIGAGLTATEASRRRAEGTTVEQAAALRALRRAAGPG